MIRSLSRRNPNWRGLHHSLDPERLPCVIDLMPPRWIAWLVVAIGLGWMLVTYELVGELALGTGALSYLGLLFPAVGLVFGAFGLRAQLERRHATFGRDGVEVTGRSLGAARASS